MLTKWLISTVMDLPTMFFEFELSKRVWVIEIKGLLKKHTYFETCLSKKKLVERVFVAARKQCTVKTGDFLNLFITKGGKEGSQNKDQQKKCYYPQKEKWKTVILSDIWLCLRWKGWARCGSGRSFTVSLLWPLIIGPLMLIWAFFLF